MWENAVNRFRTKNPKTMVDFVAVPSTENYWDKVLAMLTSGTPVDVLNQHSTRIVPFASMNLLLDLTNLVRRSPMPKDVYPFSLKLFSYHDKPYGIAWDIAMQGVLYNRTIVEGAGVKLTDDWTWDTYLDIAKQLTRGEGPSRIFGSELLPTGLQFLNGWIESNGGHLFDAQQTKCTITDPPAVDTLQWIADLRYKHHVAPTPEEAAGQGDLFQNGRIALKVGGNWIAIDAVTGAKTQGWQPGAMPLPKGKIRRAGMMGGSAHSIAAGSKEPDAAWDLTKHMSLDDDRIKEFGSTGRTMSPRESLAQYSIPQGIDAAAFKKAFIDTMSTAGVTPAFTPNWTEIDKVFTTELTTVWQGKRSAAEAAAAIKPQIDVLLSQLSRR